MDTRPNVNSASKNHRSSRQNHEDPNFPLAYNTLSKNHLKQVMSTDRKDLNGIFEGGYNDSGSSLTNINCNHNEPNQDYGQSLLNIKSSKE